MRNYLTSYGYYQVQHETIYSSILSEMPVPTSFNNNQGRSSQASSDGAGKNLLKLLIVGGLCSATPDPSACLAGAASGATGAAPPRISGTSYSGSSSNKQCQMNSDCGYGLTCVSRLGKSTCVKLTDRYGQKILDRSTEPAQCRRNSDCPSSFSCDRALRVCLQRW
jgi:hypothetical protein